MSTRTAGLEAGLYLHKDGGYYFVTGTFVRNSTNGPDDGKEMVEYFSLAHGHKVVRERVEFCASVEWSDGRKRPRFMPVLWTTIYAQMGEFRGYVDSAGAQPNFLLDALKGGR